MWGLARRIQCRGASGGPAALRERTPMGKSFGRRPMAAILSGHMARQLSRKAPLAELHCHLGAAVTPAIMWGIAHAQGIKLPTKDYWEFRELITATTRHGHSFNGYL